jgi:FKBP-type peptidyl-prolyl cis-trans isomerase FkpA
MNFFILIVSTFVLNNAFADSRDDLAKEKELSAVFLLNMAKEPNAQTVERGVVIRPIFKSTSEIYPNLTDNVAVSYYLSDREGKLIEESLSSDEIVEFPLMKLIACWQIALPKMSVGSFYKISCPSDTAYGDRGAGDGLIKPGAALSFRVTLFGTKP